MRKSLLIVFLLLAMIATIAMAQAPASGPYKILKTAKVGGAGGFDYVNADSVNRRLYVARNGQGARLTVFNLDTLQPAGEIPMVAAHGAVIDPKSNHGFGSSKPVTMFDAKTVESSKRSR